ncbi:MAG TPA: matrixin family metalloprotease [Bryobacteraceae bacterium]|nr:matrixin family metalloprotease [Bryobacteraceae bacterium]
MMRETRRMLRLSVFGIAALLLVTPSQAYYHYVHFLTGAPYTPVPEAFDLTALPNRTISFFVSDSGAATYGPNDSYGSILSQVKQAAAVWNSVASSALRVHFGGLEAYSATPASNTPAGDVVFQELPPGLLGLGTPEMPVSATVQTGPNGQFFPISRGLVILTNTTDPKAPYGPGPSYLEEFFTTAVHEFGHALGLQHTWTASAMSQDMIRNTSRARPLDADDIASISELYGPANWMANFGSISGQVTAGGQGVNLASVVAIPGVGPAVSALTNPDGTYTINGLPPGQYLLYVHPLPPDAVPANGSGLALPVDVNGNASFPRSGYFQTLFYPGTINPQQATTFTVTAGQALTGENFAVQPRAAVPIYDLVTYNYLDPVSRTYIFNPGQSIFLSPAYAGTSQQFLRLYALANTGPTPYPLSAALLGPGIGRKYIQMFGGYIVADFENLAVGAAGPRHLVLTFNTAQGPDIYVLPDAITVVQNGPPEISSLTVNPDGSVAVGGAGLTTDSRVFFDGLQTTVVTPFTAADPANLADGGVISVMPPDGVGGQASTVTVFNADNQNSMFLQAANPVTYSYPAANAPQLTGLNPSALPAGYTAAGTASMVDITTVNTNFIDGQVTVGFGTSDISVRHVWVLSPTHLVADVVVANNAAAGSTSLYVISGFQVITQPAAFQIQPANPNLPAIALPIYNALTYVTNLHAGEYASIFGSNLSLTSTSAVVTLNGTAVPVTYASAPQINFIVPDGFPSGLATLVLNNGAFNSFPVIMPVYGAPPVINSVVNAAGVTLDSTHAANPGDVLSVQVTNLDPGVLSALNRVQVSLSGVPMSLLNITQVSAAATGQPASAGVFQIQFAVTQSFAGSQVPLVVAVDGSASAPLAITAM